MMTPLSEDEFRGSCPPSRHSPLVLVRFRACGFLSYNFAPVHCQGFSPLVKAIVDELFGFEIRFLLEQHELQLGAFVQSLGAERRECKRRA